MPEVIINDKNWHEHISVTVGGERKGRGYVPRNIETHPFCFSKFSKPFEALDMPLIPRNDWPERIRQTEAEQATLIHLRRRAGPNGGHIPSLDQDGVGYCWNHSVTMMLMMCRAAMNLPYKRLSAFFIGCLIKNYRDEGGWGCQGLDFAIANGIPTVEFWPEKSMNRSNDNAATRDNALLHKVSEFWMDMALPQYDRNLTEDQAGTCLLSNIGILGDFNWWSHSVFIGALVLSQAAKNGGKFGRKGMLKTDFDSLDLRVAKDRAIFEAVFGKKGINSWTDDYGDKGEFVLEGSKAVLDGSGAILTTLATAA